MYCTIGPSIVCATPVLTKTQFMSQFFSDQKVSEKEVTLITGQSDSTMSLYRGDTCTSVNILDQCMCAAKLMQSVGVTSLNEIAKDCSMSEKMEAGMILVNIDSCRGLCNAKSVLKHNPQKIS